MYLFKPISNKRGLWSTWSKFPGSRPPFNPLTAVVSSWSAELLLAFELWSGLEGSYPTSSMLALLSYRPAAMIIASSSV